jgi:hypothetical protein
MADIKSFEKTLKSLLDANPHARSKGDAFKEWCEDNFEKEARISHIKEQRQTTNRVSEQFRYFSPIVVFVIDPTVKRETCAIENKAFLNLLLSYLAFFTSSLLLFLDSILSFNSF